MRQVFNSVGLALSTAAVFALACMRIPVQAEQQSAVSQSAKQQAAPAPFRMAPADRQRLQLALVDYNAGNVQAAEPVLRQIADRYPQHAEAQAAAGMAMAELGSIAEALTYLQRAHTLAPRDTEVALNLAVAQVKTGHSKDAVAVLQAAVRQKPAEASVYAALAQAQFETGDADAAALSFAHADALLRAKAAHTQAQSRRAFLRNTVGAGAAGCVFGPGAIAAQATVRNPKAVVVTFGGGARDAETFAPEGQVNIPHMLRDLVPQSTFYTQVINHGILGHYVATASLATGVDERFNNFAAVQPENPTIFEYMRRDLNRPADDVWVVAPSNGFGNIGESSHRLYGAGLGARVILPKHLLAAALRGESGQSEHLLRDNYETTLFDPSPTGSVSQEELHRTAELLDVSVSDFRAHATTLSSPDELSF